MSSIDKLPDFLKPSLKLFMSVDLVGSTKLKHDEDVLSKKDIGDTATLDTVGANWFSSLIDFYSGFEQKFTEQWLYAFTTEGIAETHWKSVNTPSLWKINGDELIYVLTIHHPGQIVVALYA
ncbi:hypothetical protein N9W89_13540 [Hellea sp.]|nr:hypothetical protein [Hellea sp.]